MKILHLIFKIGKIFNFWEIFNFSTNFGGVQSADLRPNTLNNDVY